MSEHIAEIARKYIGEHEKPQNSGFVDAEFERKMKEVGWQKSQAWCAYFSELVWTEAYAGNAEALKEIKAMFTGGALKTYQNFSKSKLFKVSNVPVVGAVMIMRHGDGWQGHAGVVVEVIDLVTIKTVEGNTNSSGGREGIEVAPKTRLLNEPHHAAGLNIIGFILPLEV